MEDNINYNKNSFLRENRIKKIRSMYNNIEFKGKIYFFGCGAVGKPLLLMLLKIVKINPKNILLIDKEDLTDEIKIFTDLGVNYIRTIIDEKTYKIILRNAGKTDIIIDCAYNINTYDLINLCAQKGCNYINSCIEDWDYKTVADPIKYSLYSKHKELEKLNDTFPIKTFNAIVSMGCNPGNVSIWIKVGLEMINKKYNHTYQSYAELAKKLGIQVIHISERDTQRTKVGKRVNEYCNTWSTDGESFFEEALGCVEASWGTHEKKVPEDVIKLEDNFIILDRMGIHTYAQSVVPLYGRFIGNIIRHDESHSIGKELELKENNEIIYKPSVYYVYHPCDSARVSIEELKEKDYEYQKKYRLLTDEITRGRDILGLTFYLENKEVYWIGSILSIDEAREIFEYSHNKWINATNVQVMIGYLSGIIHLIELINEDKYNGLMFPDNLPHKKIMKFSKAFLGEFIFKKIDDFQLIKYDKKFTNNNSYTNDWQFENFVI